MKVLDDKYVLKPSQNYRGLSYNDLLIMWHRWLMSKNPDQNFEGDILFLRGNIGYHQDNSSYLHASIEIIEGKAILVPIITTHYKIGEYYNKTEIKDEFNLRKAIKEHVDAATKFWAILQFMDKSNTLLKLVPNLEFYRVESMPFELNVSEENPFLDKMDEPNRPGTFMAQVGGYFVLLHNLPPSTYRIRFGGIGMNGFHTESLYEIKIVSKQKAQKDISSSMFAPERLLKEKKNVIKI
ncbi:MAG TPA: hypothetical protein VJ697_16450 [Nitrososphaeraceae archaeon]|nr:hypothetical protein [Nitrososphaeraceae archaeon]